MTLDDDIEKARSEHLFSEKSEMGQVMDNLDSNDKIDFNTRLSNNEIRAILTTEEFVKKGFLPGISIHTTAKRLKVSRDGKGRAEKVSIFAGERDFRGGGSIGERLKSLFVPRQ